MKLAIAQINPTVGAIDANRERISAARRTAAESGAQIVVTGELALSGYPPEDLVLRRSFLEQIARAAQELAVQTADGGPAILLGAPWAVEGKARNAALLLDGGAITAVRFKHHLPNYGVFDEARFFTSGPLPEPVEFRGHRLGVMICEDMWRDDVASHLKATGAETLVVLNGSPFEVDKPNQRAERAQARVRETGLPLIYVNQVGGQDELVFDGASFVLDKAGKLTGRLPAWREAVCLADATEIAPQPEPLEAIYQAMMLGLRDYVNKNGFPGVVLGLSGGIDSALSAAVAVDALGPSRVHCVMMPSPFTSQDSLEDADGVGRLLGTGVKTISIEPAMKAFTAMLAPSLANQERGTTDENIQARARGLTLMALSNAFGPLVLSTGNKSEMSVGYATLYGDMCGGYSVLKDVYKTTVFALSRWRNQAHPSGGLGPVGPVMPERVITKAPTAELKHNQTDQDTLPPYAVLDDILHGLIELDMSLSEIVARGHAADLAQRVWRMINRAEYKRRQAPPGVKISSRALSRDRRYPITDAFKDLS